MVYRATRTLKRSILSTPLLRLIIPRKAHLYCVGTAKSGTHSIASIFGDQLRSAHEPESSEVIDMILDLAIGRIGDEDLRRYVLRRDRRLMLEVDSSQLNFFLLDKLVEIFPDAKFILTIRNPCAWLDSFINHQLSRQASDKWKKLRDFRFRPDLYTHSQAEQILKKRGLYTLDGYLSYWAHHNRTVIDTIPKDRLLIVRTDKISECADEIVTFSGVSGSNFRQGKSHILSNKPKLHLLDEIEREYLECKIKEHCGELMARFFPETQSRDNTLPVDDDDSGLPKRSISDSSAVIHGSS